MVLTAKLYVSTQKITRKSVTNFGHINNNFSKMIHKIGKYGIYEVGPILEDEFLNSYFQNGSLFS